MFSEYTFSMNIDRDLYSEYIYCRSVSMSAKSLSVISMQPFVFALPFTMRREEEWIFRLVKTGENWFGSFYCVRFPCLLREANFATPLPLSLSSCILILNHIEIEKEIPRSAKFHVAWFFLSLWSTSMFTLECIENFVRNTANFPTSRVQRHSIRKFW